MGLATTIDITASLRRAAILLTTLDAGVARRMLDSLPPPRRGAVRRAMLALTDVDPLERKRALQDFLKDAAQQHHRGGHAAAGAEGVELQLEGRGREGVYPTSPNPRAAARRPLDEPEASSLPTTGESPAAAPLAFLGDVRDDVLFGAVAGEHPQTVAIVLASLPPHQAARLLPRLEDSLRGQAMMRLGRLEHLPPDALDSIGDHLRRLLADTQPRRVGGGAGGRSLLAILAEVPGELRRSMTQSLELDPALIEAWNDQPSAADAPQPHADPNGSVHPSGPLRIAPATRASVAGPAADGRPSVEAPFDRPVAARVGRATMAVDPHDGEADDPDAIAAVGHSASRTGGPDTDALDRQLMALSPDRLRDALAAVPAREALLALCGLQAEVADAVLASLPRRQARQVRKQLKTIGPLRLRDIDRAKQQVAAAAGIVDPFHTAVGPAALPIAA